MVEVPRRVQRVSVALPASFTGEIPHLREKTSRIGLIARALAIFRIDEAIIYNDLAGGRSDNDGRVFAKILEFLATPQYLRRILFSRDLDLQYVGVLPPIRSPSHPSASEPQTGLVREAVVVEAGTPSMVNAGFQRLVTIRSKLTQSQRVTIRLTGITPRLEGELVQRSRLPIYWGFEVTRTDFGLGELLRRGKQDLIISTSRKGDPVKGAWNDLGRRWRSARNPIVLFGSPSEDVREILAKEKTSLESTADFNLNTIPRQGVETVRTEEAVFATLSELNLLEEA